MQNRKKKKKKKIQSYYFLEAKIFKDEQKAIHIS